MCMSITGIIFVILVYFLLLLAELESQQISASKCCKKLNRLVLVNFLLHSLVCLIHILSANYICLLLTLALPTWIFYEMYSVPRSHKGVFDPFEVTDETVFSRHSRKCQLHLFYTVGMNCFYLHRYMQAHVNEKIIFPEENAGDHFPDMEEF